MAMTRRDYVLIAGALERVWDLYVLSECDDRVHPSEVLERVISEVGGVLAADNPRFDEGRFIAAAVSGEVTR